MLNANFRRTFGRAGTGEARLETQWEVEGLPGGIQDKPGAVLA